MCNALKAHGGMFPHQQGQRTQQPPTRGIFHDFVGIPVLVLPQPWPIAINLTEEHQYLLQLLGTRDAWFYR
jgi:hypothetical protein